MSNELIEGDELSDEQKAADAALIAADMGPIYLPMLEEKRRKAVAKTGHRKKKDRRFKLLDGEAEGSASPATKEDDPWDSSVPLSDEVRRIALIVHSYLDPRAVGNTFLADAKKADIILKVFDGRQQTTANLLKLYAFMQTKYPNGGRCLSSSPLFYLVEEILLKAGDIKEPLSQPMTVMFGDEFSERPAADEEEKI